MRAVIADDSVLMREGITRILAEGDIEVIAGVGDAPSLLEVVEKCKPDLAIIDVRMPPAYIDEGLRAAIEIRHRWPAVALVVLSQFAIADALVISARAVEKHIASIFIKLDLPPDTGQYHRRVMAVVRYLNS
jgi:DNA-binding NarL/FixJ family response regulator